MSSAINSTFSFNPEELKDWTLVINELTFNNPQLTQIHDVQEGIKHDMQIVFAGRMGLMGKKITSCTPNEIEGIQLTQKFWRPVFEDFRLKHCSADVNEQDKLVNQMARMNPDYFNVIEGSSSVLGNFLVGKVTEAFNENIIRKVWFSDTAADTIANGGVLTNGTDVDYFNTFDGLFKQYFADILTTDKNYVEITANQGASYAAQVLGDGDSMAVLKSMYNSADSRLQNSPNIQFLVTRSLWDGYLNDLESTQNAGAGNTFINENGQLTLTYRGIPVVKMEKWDRVIEEYENDGTKLNLPHRAVLTTPDNIPVGTLAQSDFGTLNAFYDQYFRENVIDGTYSIDSKHLENYLSVIAY